MQSSIPCKTFTTMMIFAVTNKIKNYTFKRGFPLVFVAHVTSSTCHHTMVLFLIVLLP